MNKLRLRFSKTGRAIYISHLDLMHTLQRAFSRAGYQLDHSEGFNPHPVLSIALPLSVGTSSLCEVLDFRLTADADPTEIPARLNQTLPEGIEVLEAYVPERKAAELRYLSIQGVFDYDDRTMDAEALREFFLQESILVSKKSKKGIVETDIRPMMKEVSSADGCLHAIICAQEPTLNPDLLVAALERYRPDLAPDFARFTRLETFDGEMNIFR